MNRKLIYLVSLALLIGGCSDKNESAMDTGDAAGESATMEESPGMMEQGGAMVDETVTEGKEMAEKAGDEMESAAQDAGDAMKEAGEDASEAAGEAMHDAGEHMDQ